MNFAPFLVLPVVGGYAFSIIWIGSLYNSSRESGHRLYFRSVFYAVFLVVCAFLFHILWFGSGWYEYLLSIIHETMRNTGEVSIFGMEARVGILLMSFVLGPVFGIGLNIIQLQWLAIWSTKYDILKHPWLQWWQTLILKCAIRNNDFERLLFRAIKSDSPIMFTLNNGKVYIGKVVRGPNPIEQRRAIRIAPLISGFRDSETHEFIDTTDYYEAIAELRKPKEERAEYFKNLSLEDFEIVIPSDQLCSSHLFDIDVFANHFLNNDHENNDIVDDPGDKPVLGDCLAMGNAVACGGRKGFEHPKIYLKTEGGLSDPCPYCAQRYEVICKAIES